jgi:hypothetical protein
LTGTFYGNKAGGGNEKDQFTTEKEIKSKKAID